MDEVKEYEEEVLHFITKNIEPAIFSDCCHADVELFNKDRVESVWCTKCGQACNAISEGYNGN